ncbi:hypothetical protein [Chloroflexus sp.]|uniref:hypothetical protein n=1 Tax=Chloroflexus sp. TaxID=1904827 RepID=UPI003D0CE260
MDTAPAMVVLGVDGVVQWVNQRFARTTMLAWQVQALLPDESARAPALVCQSSPSDVGFVGGILRGPAAMPVSSCARADKQASLATITLARPAAMIKPAWHEVSEI